MIEFVGGPWDGDTWPPLVAIIDIRPGEDLPRELVFHGGEGKYVWAVDPIEGWADIKAIAEKAQDPGKIQACYLWRPDDHDART